MKTNLLNEMSFFQNKGNEMSFFQNKGIEINLDINFEIEKRRELFLEKLKAIACYSNFDAITGVLSDVEIDLTFSKKGEHKLYLIGSFMIKCQKFPTIFKTPNGKESPLFDFESTIFYQNLIKEHNLLERTFLIEINRTYIVRDQIEVDAYSEEEAIEKAIEISGNKDYMGNFHLDEVETLIIEEIVK